MAPAILNIRHPRPLLATLLMAAGTALFAVVALVSAKGLREAQELTDLRGRHYESLVQVEAVLSELKDLETGQRGFLITGDDAFLEPYLNARRFLDENYRHLRSNLAGIPVDDAFWPRLDQLVRQRVSLAERNIRLRREGRFLMFGDLNQLAEGKAVMDALRRELGLLERHRRQEIEQLSADLESRRQAAFGVTVAAAVFGIFLMLAALLMFLREQERRLDAEAVLASANQRLEQQVQARTAEVQAALERIRSFAGEQDRKIEAERRRLAREVHDQIGQIFTALKLLIRPWVEHFAQEERLQQQFGEFTRLLDEGVNTARRITAELRPPLLDDLGLGAALEHHFNKFAAPAGLACRVELLHDRVLDRTQATALFRIAQEALTNTQRHAGAGRVVVRDSLEDGHYSLAIEDDGSGFATGAEASHGLRGMAERAALVGGQLRLAAAESGGVCIQVRLPVDTENGEMQP